VEALTADIDAAFKKTGLSAEKELRQRYLDRVPHWSAGPSSEERRRTDHASAPLKLDADRFNGARRIVGQDGGKTFDGLGDRKEFKEPDSVPSKPEVKRDVVERHDYVFTRTRAQDPEHRASLPAGKGNLFDYKPEGREAERAGLLEMDDGRLHGGDGGRRRHAAHGSGLDQRRLGPWEAWRWPAYGISQMPDGGVAENLERPPKDRKKY